mgnify:CR=1 FL=1
MSDYVIETRGLTKTYGEQNSVSNLSIHVRKGRIYGLLGRNGAGKTTTMRMLLGLTAPSSGDVKIFGKPLRGNEKNILPRIGSLIESPGFYPNLTGTENLRIFADLRGLKSPKYIKGALEVVNLPYRDKKLFSQYSLGMKQRLAIALAVMHNPELLILDEPINGLDPIGIAEVRDFIRELCDATGKTILISSCRRSPCWPMTSESLTTAYCWKKKAWRSWKQRTGSISVLRCPMLHWLLTCFRANLAFRISKWTVPMS